MGFNRVSQDVKSTNNNVKTHAINEIKITTLSQNLIPYKITNHSNMFSL